MFKKDRVFFKSNDFTVRFERIDGCEHYYLKFHGQKGSREYKINLEAEKIPIDPRYLTNIENKGQHTSLDIFYKLVTLFDISVDQFFYSDTAPDRSTRRRQLDNVLDSFNDNDLIIIEATAEGIKKAKEKTEA